MDLTIREAQTQDADTLLRLIDALADYEHLPRPDPEARERFKVHGFGHEPYFQALIAEADHEAIGYAIYFFTYSTFLARPTLYLEDIFVLPEARKHGTGRELMRHLAEEALDKGCGRFEWQVLGWNQLARGFYENLGAKHQTDWLPYRLTREDMETLLAQQEGAGGA